MNCFARQVMVISAWLLAVTFAFPVQASTSSPDTPHVLSIPTLGVREAPIVLIPIVNGAWDESRLGAREVGLLQTTGRAPLDTYAPVLAAHVTLEGGVRGVFYGLGTLRRGDRIELRTKDGRLWQYRVVGQRLLHARDVKRIYQPDGKRLLLLTCALWNERLGRYTHRLLVEAVLEQTLQR